jgi:eukaryotic-like serine/threonine-protein kinase
MPDSLADFDPEVAALAADVVDDFRARRARGEDPDPEEYVARHPYAAAAVRGVLAALRLAAPSGASAATQSPPLLPSVLGDYRIVREVGRGGMGVVYEAEQLSLRRRVALKVLPFAAVMDPRALQRFHNEALAAAALDHPHVVKVYGVGQDRGVHFIALQFVDGRTLADLIRERRGQPVGPAEETRTAVFAAADTTVSQSEPQAAAPPARPEKGSAPSRTPVDTAYARRVAEWGIQAAEALEHAHTLGVVHRDIKPGNLLMDARGHLWVADFGLARVSADPGMTETGALLGTPRYMSPEQAAAAHGLVDHRSDVYSLGATLYELLTLEPAVGGRDRAEVLKNISLSDPTAPRRLAPEIPRDLETVVLKCLAKEPRDRYQSAAALAADLRRWQEHKPLLAKRESRLGRARRWCRRNPAMAALAAVILLASVGLSASTVLFWKQKQRAQEEHQRADGLYRQTQELYQQSDAAYQKEVRHRKRARQAVDTMYTEVAEHLLPTEPGLSGARKQFLLKALAFYEEEAVEQPAEPEVRVATAWANQRAGRILWANGDARRALELYNRAVALAEQLAAEAPEDLERHRTQAQFYFERSFMYEHLSRAPDARADRRRALAMYERLAREHPTNVVFRVNEAHICGALALALSDPIESEALFRKCLERADQLAADFPTQPENTAEVAIAGLRFGQFLAGRPDRLDEAERLLVRALPLWRAMVDGPNFHPERLFHLGQTLAHLGRVRARREPSDPAAREYFAQARTELSRLDRDYPGHTFSGLHWLGVTLLGDGRTDEAVDCFRESIRVRADSATTHSELGIALATQGKWVEAETAMKEGIARDPSGRQRVRLAGALRHLAAQAAKLGRTDEAVTALRRIIGLTFRLALAQPDEVPHGGHIISAADSLAHLVQQPQDRVLLIETADELVRERATDPAATVTAARLLNRALQLADKDAGLVRADRDREVLAHRTRIEGLLDEVMRTTDFFRQGWLMIYAARDIDGGLAYYDQALNLDPQNYFKINGVAWILLTHPDPAKRDPRRAMDLARQQVELNPGHPWGLFNLALGHYRRGDWQAALETERRAEPDCDDFRYQHHLLLCMAHWQLGELHQAREEYAQALQLVTPDLHARRFEHAGFRLEAAELLGRPADELTRLRREVERSNVEPTTSLEKPLAKFDLPHVYWDLGLVLLDIKELEAAAAAFARATRLRPDMAEAQMKLGVTLLQLGRFQEALPALRRGHEVGRRRRGWDAKQSARWVRQAESLVALDDRLPALVAGTAQVATPKEGATVAELCLVYRSRPAAAARFYAAAFTADPTLAVTLDQDRYNAACAAARAAAGDGEDAKDLPETERTRLQQQALGWLTDELAGWRRVAGMPFTGPRVQHMMKHWRQDPDLAGVRDPDRLAKLSADERQAWAQLWEQANELVAEGPAAAGSK